MGNGEEKWIPKSFKINKLKKLVAAWKGVKMKEKVAVWYWLMRE